MTYSHFVMRVTVRVGEGEPIVYTKVRSVSREGKYLRIFFSDGNVEVFFISDTLSFTVDFYEIVYN